MPRVTQKTIAEELGLTQATVSMALRGNPTVAKSTRYMVMEAAERLGYTPDPFLVRLATYRRKSGPTTFHGTLAWIVSHPTREGWADWKPRVDCYNSVVRAASKMGYNVSSFWLREPGMNSKRFTNILSSQGIEGIIMAPEPNDSDYLTYPDWERFSAIKIGNKLLKVHLHQVVRDDYDSMRLTMSKLKELGYKRPGLAMHESSEIASHGRWAAAYHSAEQKLRESQRIPVCKLPREDDAESLALFANWVQTYQPDAIISARPEVHRWLVEEIKMDVPGKIGFVSLCVTDGDQHFSGVLENSSLLGATAVDYVTAMVARGERGLPEHPISLALMARWADGKTIKKLKAAKAADAG